MSGRLRTVLFWCHLAAGLTAGIVVAIMSITGVALTFQKEMQYWADTRTFVVTPPAGGTRAPVAALIAAVEAAEPGAAVSAVAWASRPDRPAAVTAGSRTIYVDPYTAAVFGEGTGQSMRAFFASMTSWHRYLGRAGESRPAGRAVTGAANVLFLLLVLSGMYLWWPRTWTWTQFRNVIWFRRNLAPKARDFNWHHTFGFWFALPLVFVVASGVVISYPWASNAVYRVMGEEPPAAGRGGRGGPVGPAGGRGGRGQAVASTAPAGRAERAEAPPADAARGDLDRVVEVAMARQPDWQTVTLRVPEPDAASVVVQIDRGDAGQPNLRGTATIDRATGAVRQWEDFASQTPGRRLRTILRFTHTGEIGGLAGQTLAGLASLAAALLVYSGVALSIRRWAAWRSRQAARRVVLNGARAQSSNGSPVH